MGIYGVDGGHNVDGRRICHSFNYERPQFDNSTKEEKIKEWKEKLKYWRYRVRYATRKYEKDEPEYCKESVEVCKRKLQALKEE